MTGLCGVNKPSRQIVQSTLAVTLGPSKCTSEAGFLTIVGVPDRVAKLAIELRAVEHDLLRMHRFDGAHGHREVTGILDIDYQLGPAIRRHLADGAELLASIGSKRLKSYFDFFLHVNISAGNRPDDELAATCDIIRRTQFRVELSISAGCKSLRRATF